MPTTIIISGRENPAADRIRFGITEVFTLAVKRNDPARPRQ
jgi:hypothetical protein